MWAVEASAPAAAAAATAAAADLEDVPSTWGHTDAVLCVDAHPTRPLVAQQGLRGAAVGARAGCVTTGALAGVVAGKGGWVRAVLCVLVGEEWAAGGWGGMGWRLGELAGTNGGDGR